MGSSGNGVSAYSYTCVLPKRVSEDYVFEFFTRNVELGFHRPLMHQVEVMSRQARSRVPICYWGKVVGVPNGTAALGQLSRKKCTHHDVPEHGT